MIANKIEQRYAPPNGRLTSALPVGVCATLPYTAAEIARPTAMETRIAVWRTPAASDDCVGICFEI